MTFRRLTSHILANWRTFAVDFCRAFMPAVLFAALAVGLTAVGLLAWKAGFGGLGLTILLGTLSAVLAVYFFVFIKFVSAFIDCLVLSRLASGEPRERVRQVIENFRTRTLRTTAPPPRFARS